MTPESGSAARRIGRLRTPAKINLGLRLTGRRPDGYHLLESLFVPIDLHDEVELEWLPGPDRSELRMSTDPGSELPAALQATAIGSDNLVVRAAEAFRRASGLEGYLRLRLRKAIAAGAGLGGGSSDAGAVLRLLVSLAGDRSPGSEAISRLALELGADVPFFLEPGPALVTGIGEQISPVEGLPGLELVLANPGISVATAEVYRVADALADSLTPGGAGSTMRAISRLQGESGDRLSALGDLLENDLQPAAIRLCPPIGRLIARMRELGAVAASMSGSGATVFGVFDSAEAAAKAARELHSSSSSQEIWVRRTRTLARREVDRISWGVAKW